MRISFPKVISADPQNKFAMPMLSSCLMFSKRVLSIYLDELFVYAHTEIYIYIYRNIYVRIYIYIYIVRFPNIIYEVDIAISNSYFGFRLTAFGKEFFIYMYIYIYIFLYISIYRAIYICRH